MAKLNVNITIDDFVAESSAVTHLYINQVHICSLSDENKTFTGSIPIDGDNVLVSINSTYNSENQSDITKNPFKKVISYIALFVVNMFSVPEPLECPYEYEENIKLSIEGSHPKLSIDLSKQSVDEQPQLIIQNEDTSMERTSKCFVNHSVLKEIFAERKKAVNVFALVPCAVLLLLILLFAFFRQYITLGFLSLIFVLILAVFFYSKHGLTKKYQEYLKKAENGE